MKPSLAAVVALTFGGAVAVATLRPAHGDEPAGLALFKKNGCNECHVISSLGVEKESKKKSDEPVAAESETKKKKKEPPDLSGVGLEHEAKWISAYLNKEETLDGEKHEKRFKGTESERRTVAMWLASLKTEVKKAPAEEKPTEEKKGLNEGATKDGG
jgi:cytochrome c peroxidase